jgi:uncharacterized protein YbcC (UPF0753/DUF2309 family)
MGMITLPPTTPLGPLEAAERAVRQIPPVWPLASSVAVNPFLGQSQDPLWLTAARLGRVAGVAVTMERSWYRQKVASGEITDADLGAALAQAPSQLRPAGLAALKDALMRDAPVPEPVPTLADLCARATGFDWPGFIDDRLGLWASSWFDKGQALWPAGRGNDAYVAWRTWAIHDLSPDIAGLRGFAAHVADAPDSAAAAIGRAVQRLGLRDEALDSAFHRLLVCWGGWAQLARHRLWEAELAGGTDAAPVALLAIRLLWEEALLEQYGEQVAGDWRMAVEAHAATLQASPDQVIDAVLQEAADRAAQRRLAAALGSAPPAASPDRPALQAAFCIDVRSEVIRRALESVAPRAGTLGFAGFFGLTAAHRRFASDVEEKRLPVLLNPTVFSCSGGPEQGAKDHDARILARARRAWSRFKLAAVSSFAFVEAAGPLYFGKLLMDSLAVKDTAWPSEPAPRLSPALDLAARTGAAETILRAMSLTGGFARLVLLVGHGARTVNNPHASALHCGACGGYSGEVNARLLATLLNDPEVREGLAQRGIAVPQDTLFLAGLHDTTTDEVMIYAEDHARETHRADVAQARDWLAAAGKLARSERALKLPRAASGDRLARRSRDWAEVRPEWGLAGCKSFIAAPRSRTAGKLLDGRAFLHDYDWTKDTGFGVLELIMTAPVVVASWISLQYYGSTVAPTLFGAGNKLLHNVTGGIGVVEGNGGNLRVGLPWQSVHDGEKLVHEPLRLSVCIEAPVEAMTDILRRHPEVRALFDNRWLHLFALDSEGRLAWRYAGELHWTSETPGGAVEQPDLRLVS